MFDSIQRAVSSYTSKPIAFVGVAFIHLALQLLVLLALLGVFLIGFFITSIIKVPVDSPPMLALAVILVILFFYFSSGVKGAALNAYSNVLNGEKVNFFDFYHYSLRKAPRFFGLFLVRSVFQLLPVGVLAALYFFVIKNWNLPYADAFVAFFSLLFTFIVHYIFYGAFVSAAVYDSGIKDSLKNCFKFLKFTHIFALILYVAYAIIWLTQFVPIINIITFFVSFPIAYSAMVVYFQKIISGKPAAIPAAAPEAAPSKYKYKKRQKKKEEKKEEKDEDKEEKDEDKKVSKKEKEEEYD